MYTGTIHSEFLRFDLDADELISRRELPSLLQQMWLPDINQVSEATITNKLCQLLLLMCL